MPTELLPCVEVPARGAANAVVLWLHGLGADGHDFPPIVPHLGLERELSVRFVFPHAPKIPVTINAGMVMPAWYDIRESDFIEDTRVVTKRHDETGIRRSADQVRALIEREIERGVPARRIVLAGFSQGGAVAAYVALRHAQPLAGLIALSTYLAGGDSLAAEISSANRGLTMFQGHGLNDPLVRHERGVAMRNRLVELGCDVTWREYPMEHAVCMEEIADIGAWLNEKLRG